MTLRKPRLAMPMDIWYAPWVNYYALIVREVDNVLDIQTPTVVLRKVRSWN